MNSWDICQDCQEPEPCECLLIGTGQPGRDRAAWIKLHGPASTEPGPAHPLDA